jgi:hypothetical protein
MALLKQRWQFDDEFASAPGKIKKVVYKNKATFGDTLISNDLMSWMKSDAGKFVWNHSCPEPTLHKIENIESITVTIAVVGYFDEKDLVLYNLKF